VTAAGRPADRAAIILAVVIAAFGVPVGVCWLLITPRVKVTVVDGGVTLTETVAETFVAADGWFAIITVAAGIASGVLITFRGRPAGPAAAVALAAGGALAALVAWRVGVFLGRAPAALDQAASAADGETLTLPLRLRAYGVLLVWAISAVATFFAGALAAGPDPTAPAEPAAPAAPAAPVEPVEPVESAWPAYRGGGRAGEPDEVGGGQLDLEAAPPSRDEDGREPER
jgi:hypothetical protein